MTQIPLNNGDTGLEFRTALNTMLEELYLSNQGLSPAEIVDAIDVFLETTDWRAAYPDGLAIPIGAWSGSTNYGAGAFVFHEHGIFFLPTGTSLNQEPGVAGAWEQWFGIAGLPASMTIICDATEVSSGIALPLGLGMTVESWKAITDDPTGSVTVDLRMATGVPDSGDSITGSAPITLTSAQTGASSTLTGWTTTLVSGQYIRAHVTARAGDVTWVAITLYGVRT